MFILGFQFQKGGVSDGRAEAEGSRWLQQQVRAHTSNHKQEPDTGSSTSLLKSESLLPVTYFLQDCHIFILSKQPPTGRQAFKCPRLMGDSSFRPPQQTCTGMGRAAWSITKDRVASLKNQSGSDTQDPRTCE